MQSVNTVKWQIETFYNSYFVSTIHEVDVFEQFSYSLRCPNGDSWLFLTHTQYDLDSPGVKSCRGTPTQFLCIPPLLKNISMNKLKELNLNHTWTNKQTSNSQQIKVESTLYLIHYYNHF